MWLQTEIQNCNEVLFSGGGHVVQFTTLYSEFSEFMCSSLKDQYYQPPFDTRYYSPIVYKPEFIKHKTDWLDCLVEMGKYILYLEEYSVLYPGFTRFRNDMDESRVHGVHEDELPRHSIVEIQNS